MILREKATKINAKCIIIYKKALVINTKARQTDKKASIINVNIKSDLVFTKDKWFIYTQ